MIMHVALSVSSRKAIGHVAVDWHGEQGLFGLVVASYR